MDASGSVAAAESLARSVAAVTRHRLPFRVTTGIGGALRRSDPGGARHGLVNLIVATALAARGAPLGEVAAALEDDDAEAFDSTITGLRWRHHLVDRTTIDHVRGGALTAIGACDVRRFVEDLDRVGVTSRASTARAGGPVPIASAVEGVRREGARAD